MLHSVVHTHIKKVAAAGITDTSDILATEEPLEIRLVYGPQSDRRQQGISVTMRTPGHDEELAAGFLFTEGVLTSGQAIQDVICTSSEDGAIATVHLHEHIQPRLEKVERNFQATAACGVCGKSSLAAIHTAVTVSQQNNFTIPATTLYQLPDLLRREQAVFAGTGGLHAAALFDSTGKLLLLREDIGRHNAVDKVIGARLATDQLPIDHYLLLLSGRAGFELIQKAAMAGIPAIAAIGAPSSMAVKMAEAWNITLVGFLREQRFNIYSVPDRIIL
ncbi:formate dehydrogenase accessory sulfurtransferase FdhD [Chitinophaga nivalis]|uniref:Sulfur carrier protein FdhD n=1 Tax=Chitinophaga nivalis TaxID=2991709 RepID=A0ABT3ILP3_9BACT|nr:formate dehydrogenase accessory sulfurtransferase FdhD [Chitinophaga nivalis]MCW3465650.1 formate dehydrogenase accessory sulfurtransferase FdhD [Chitinophaga nivalis]MCW3484659.1 formate dehydrogenase accessory sulfurtransferase FdhD [Chitinophaga nivalis]